MSSAPRTAGFTLIELMIATAVVGILMAIAYPSYYYFVERTWRLSAASCLLGLTAHMERHYTSQSSYAPPPSINQPCTAEAGMAKHYTFSLAAVDNTTYTLQAVPVADSAQAKDTCGTLTLDNFGQKNADDLVEKCWEQ